MRTLVFVNCGSLILATIAALFTGCGADASSGGSSSGDSPRGDGGSTVAEDAAPVGDAEHSVSATVVGLVGSGLVLHEASAGDLPVTAQPDGAVQKVTFPTKLAANAPFEVTVKTQPSSPPQSCVVTGGTGTVAAGDVESITVNCSTLYTVGGTVTGLDGKDLVLENNGADPVTVNANGQFSFGTPLPSGAAYAVTVKQHPTNKWQTCTASVGGAGASGTIAGANVTNVAVTCTTNTYAVSVDVTGLAGSGLVVQNAGADDLPVSANGTHAFGTQVESGADYDVTVLSQPTSPWQTCTVANGKGTMAGANVTLDVACTANSYAVGGTVKGLTGNGLVLQNNAGDDLVLGGNQNGPFSFATAVASGQPYAVTVKTQPTGVAGETCHVLASTASGAVGGTAVTTVNVVCGVNKKVFASSMTYSGNLGGLSGADAKCQALADAAKLPGTYMAWLSDATASPSTRFTKATIPYALVDGTVVANGWTDLVDQTLAHAIDKNELGGAAPTGTTSCGGGGQPTVWSGTSAAGTLAATTCSNWTAASGAAQLGWAAASNNYWSIWCSGANVCQFLSAIYCFQQ